MPGDASKPAVLIVGGLGFIGRHIARYIYKNNLASELRLVDKLLPQLAWLPPEFEEQYTGGRFVQADAANEQSVSKIFDRANGADFDYVINCTAGRPAQPEEYYRSRVYPVSILMGNESAKRGVKAFVELSSGLVYKNRTCNDETAEVGPRLLVVKYKRKSEEGLQKIPNLNLCILRLAFVHGEYDTHLICGPVCICRTINEPGQTVTIPPFIDNPMNTVCVDDVVRAIWTAAEWRSSRDLQQPAPVIFNIVDHSKATSYSYADAIFSAFGIKRGTIPPEDIGNLNMEEFLEDLQESMDEMTEESMRTWKALLTAKGITDSVPISPYFDTNIGVDPTMHLDGSLFERTTGFKYEYERLDTDSVLAIIESYKRANWWP